MERAQRRDIENQVKEAKERARKQKQRSPVYWMRRGK
jgi:hypothetical protein